MKLGLNGREGRVVAEERVDVEAVGPTEVVDESARFSASLKSCSRDGCTDGGRRGVAVDAP